MNGGLIYKGEVVKFEYPWFTRDVVTYLGLSENRGNETVLRYVRAGTLKAKRIGRAYRFRKEDVDRAVQMMDDRSRR